MLSQNDSRWKSKTINGTTSTLGNFGCLITCITDILMEAGYSLTPDVLASSSDLFSTESGKKDMWTGWQTVCSKYPRLKYEWGATYYSVPAPIEKIKEALDKGWCPIIMIDYNPADSDIDTHYLRVKKIDSNGNLVVGDPWDGKDVLLDTRYGSADESRKIYKIDVYSYTKETTQVSSPVTVLSDVMKRIVEFLTSEKIGDRAITEGDVREGIGYVKNGTVKGLESQIGELSTKLYDTSMALEQEKIAREKDKIDFGTRVAEIEKNCQTVCKKWETDYNDLNEKYKNLSTLPSRIEDFSDDKVLARAWTIIIDKIFRRNKVNSSTEDIK